MNYQETAKEIVLGYVNKHLDKTDNVQIALDNVYIVWFCKNLTELEGTVINHLARWYVLRDYIQRR